MLEDALVLAHSQWGAVNKADASALAHHLQTVTESSARYETAHADSPAPACHDCALASGRRKEASESQYHA